ncbi:CobW family GTP-binding protein [Actinomadura fibrosa]|uniref:CobW family GTP-binding protein n=1 Tax=Actinomadura fibrosa TaxID=111802 RepID=A0ABW2XYC4_9ACTN|nr:GTP-binding protein [Actinomadura fibrosa]
MPTPVVLVAGIHGTARAAAVDRLLREHPGALAIHHDLRGIAGGRVVRTVRDAGATLDRTEIRLEHGCVTCTVRQDLIPRLLDHAGRAPLLIVELWDCVEPRPVAEALGHPGWNGEIRLTGVLTALDAELMPTDICRGERLADIGRAGVAGDERYLAEVLAHQIEYATALLVPDVLPAPLPPADQDDLDLCREVLEHLAPTTPVVLPGAPLPRVTGPALCVHELAARVDPATARLPCPLRTPAVDTVVWHRTAPLHPARFFDAMDDLAMRSVRSRGRFWLATRPDRMLAWDAVAGIVTIEDAGPWLAALPIAAVQQTSPARRIAASLDWTPEHGDRVQHLVLTGPGLDHDQIHALLDSCLLDPHEAASELDDPFAQILDLNPTA